MHRRNFLKLSAVGLLAPLSLLKAEEIDWTLKIKKLPTDPNDFVNREMIRFSKGPYFADIGFTYGQDLRDCCGLCATKEFQIMTVQNLEYGRENIEKLCKFDSENNFFDFKPSLRRDLYQQSLRRCKLTLKEKGQIYVVCHKMRGPHDCISEECHKKIDKLIATKRCQNWFSKIGLD